MSKKSVTAESLVIPKKELTFEPVTSTNWPDLAALFSEHGVQNGCWCMYWRATRADFQRNYGEGNRRLMKQITTQGSVPGILAYHHGKPVGWCSVAPRTDFPVLGRSPTLKPVDGEPVWSIVCFFVARAYRRGGLSRGLIEAAVDYAGSKGARIVEAYPIDPRAKSIEYERYTGLTTTFAKAGFKEILRRSERRPIMRHVIDEHEAG